MAMSVRDYFRASISNMLAMETDVKQMNQDLRGEVHDHRLMDVLLHHAPRNDTQINNLHQIRDRIGGQAPEEESTWSRWAKQLGMGGRESGFAVTQALMGIHKDLVDKEPPANLVDLHDAFLTRDMEHLAVSHYRSLVSLAAALGDDFSRNLLQQNLDLAQQTLDELEYAMPSLVGDLAREPVPAGAH